MIGKTLVVVLALSVGLSARAQEPSNYLGNNQRTGYVDAKLPAAPVLLWTYNEKHPPHHAWEEPNRELDVGEQNNLIEKNPKMPQHMRDMLKELLAAEAMYFFE